MILVGTIHTDLEGPRRLECLLNKYQPRTIALEAPHNYKLEDIIPLISNAKKMLRKKMKRNPNATELEFGLLDSLNYEWLISFKYAGLTGSKLYPVDCIPIELDVNFFVYSTYNMMAYVEPSCDIQKRYYNCNKSIKKESKVVSNFCCNKREKFMADKILRIKPDMFIVGLSHVFDEYLDGSPVKPLHKRLGKLVTERIRLCDADKYLQKD